MRTIGPGVVVGRNGSIFMVVKRGISFTGHPAYALADIHTGEYLSLDVSAESLYEILKLARFDVLAPSVASYFNPGAY